MLRTNQTIKTARVGLVLTPEEKQRLRDNCNTIGCSMSQLIADRCGFDFIVMADRDNLPTLKQLTDPNVLVVWDGMGGVEANQIICGIVDKYEAALAFVEGGKDVDDVSDGRKVAEGCEGFLGGVGGDCDG